MFLHTRRNGRVFWSFAFIDPVKWPLHLVLCFNEEDLTLSLLSLCCSLQSAQYLCLFHGWSSPRWKGELWLVTLALQMFLQYTDRPCTNWFRRIAFSIYCRKLTFKINVFQESVIYIVSWFKKKKKKTEDTNKSSLACFKIFAPRPSTRQFKVQTKVGFKWVIEPLWRICVL